MTNKQKKEKKLTFLNHLLAPTFFGTKSKEQEVNLVWPNLCLFWLLFICLYCSWSWSLPNFVWINISGYQNYRSSLLTGFRAEKIIYLGFVPSGGHWAKSFFSLNTNFENSVATRSPNFWFLKLKHPLITSIDKIVNTY